MNFIDRREIDLTTWLVDDVFSLTGPILISYRPISYHQLTRHMQKTELNGGGHADDNGPQNMNAHLSGENEWRYDRVATFGGPSSHDRQFGSVLDAQ